MINRLRVILPSDSVVLAVVLVFALAEGPFIFIEWKIQQPLDTPRPGLLVVQLIAILYGIWRCTHFHPAYLAEYRAWLERTPWNRKKALPGGPVHLVFEDALPLCGLAIMGEFLGPLIPYRVLGLFLVGYHGAFVSSSFRTGTRGFGYLVAFGTGLAIRYWQDSKICLLILVATHVVARIGMMVSLANFPWPYFADPEHGETLQQKMEKVCGWPFDQLKPSVPSQWKIPMLDGLAIGLLAGWFLYSCESLLLKRSDQLVMVRMVFLGGLGFLASGRLMAYTMGYSSPISLWGRIVNFRWIIPGFDKVYLGPLCTILVGVLAVDRFRPPGLDDLIVLPMALALAITVTIDTGPSLKSWRLTGQHRITATTATMGGEFVKVG